MIREALDDARAELTKIEARKAELEHEIEEAQTLLGQGPTGATSNAKLTLHEALAQVLRGSDNEGMRARELADAVNQRGLYARRDGSPVQANQVQARVNNYGALFEKAGSTIRLREDPATLSEAPADFAIFRDDDDAFFDWLEQNPTGYIINTERNPKPNYLVLHRADCPHFKGGESLHWTKDYIKVCAADRDQLEEWAADDVGGEVTLCRSCFG